MRRAGFTIVELVIAIGLLALVASLALPAGVALLAREGNRSALFMCENAIMAERTEAMRDTAIIELAVVQEDNVWTLVRRPFVAQSSSQSASSDDASFDGIELGASSDEPVWDVIATLPRGFSFRFEPMPMVMDALEVPEKAFVPVGLERAQNEPRRVAVLLPTGAVEGVEGWRLVTERDGVDDQVELLSVARWTGAISATIERPENELLGPVPTGESDSAPAVQP